MNKIALLLDKLNSIIVLLCNYLTSLFLKIVPPPIIEKLNKIKYYLQFPFTYIKKKYFISVEKTKEASKLYFEKLKSEQFKKNINDKKTNIIETVKFIFTKAAVLSFLSILLIKFKTVKAWLLSIKPQTFLATLSISAFLSLCGLKVFYKGKGLYDKTIRKPASIPEIVNKRPVYYKQEKKQYIMQDVTVPIYAKIDSNEINRLTFDLNLQLSNRFLGHVLRSRENEVKSYVNSQMQPFQADFILTKEGKKIIKKKIRSELNRYLSDQKLEGKVEQIYIEQIIAG